ncbi:MAG: WG repeat-containing protein [Deltaproteobacteria bacterium]|jgi:hypothetical protein|nr:WG repeat-containing protein [Deltaproteobacteria bacterium]
MKNTSFIILLILTWLSAGQVLRAEQLELVPDVPDVAGPGRGSPGEGQKLYPFQFNDLYGYIDGQANIVIPPAFAEAKKFEKIGLAAVAAPDKKYGVIDARGQWAVLPEMDEVVFEAAGSEEEMGIKVKKYNRWGAVDTEGHWLIKPRFTEMRYLGSRQYTAKYRKNENWALLDVQGGWLSKHIYKYLYYSFSNGAQDYLDAYIGDKEGYIDRTGRELIKIAYRNLYKPSDFNLIYASVNESSQGLLDLKGNWVIRPLDGYLSYDKKKRPNEIWHQSKKVAAAAYSLTGTRLRTLSRPELWEHVNDTKFKITTCQHLYRKDLQSFCNNQGQLVFNTYWESTAPFSDFGLAAIKKGGKWGYLDTSGRQVIGYNFQNYNSFSVHGTAVINSGELYGVINARGSWIIKPEYKSISDASSSFSVLMVTSTDSKIGVFRTNGSVMYDFIFEDFRHDWTINKIYVKYKGLWGILNADGTWFLTPKFDDITGTFSGTDYLPVKYRTKFALIDKTGKFLAYHDVACNQYVVRNGADKIIWPPAALSCS